jgi:hypothetical protein
MNTYKDIYNSFKNQVADLNNYGKFAYKSHTGYDKNTLKRNIAETIRQAKTDYTRIQLGFKHIGATFDPVQVALSKSPEDELYISLISNYEYRHDNAVFCDHFIYSIFAFKHDLQAVRIDNKAVYYPEYIASPRTLQHYLNTAGQHPNYELIKNAVFLTQSEVYVFDRCIHDNIPYLPPESMWPTRISSVTYEKWFKNCTSPCATNELKIKFLHRVQVD